MLSINEIIFLPNMYGGAKPTGRIYMQLYLSFHMAFEYDEFMQSYYIST